MRTPSITTLVVLVAFTSLAHSATLRVAEDGSGEFATIQDAVHAAASGDVIELGDGTFTGDGNRDVTVEGKALTFRSEGGSPESCVIDCEGSESDPHRALFIRSVSTETRLEALTFTGGYSMTMGGAVLAEDAALALVNCVFRDNRTDGDLTGEDTVGLGGAVGGAGCESIRIDRCEFRDNWSGVSSGAVGLTSCRVVDIIDSRFERNVVNHTDAEGGGGIGMYECSTVTIRGCDFERNETDYAGGAIDARLSSVTVHDCRFEANYARGDRQGGGGAAAFADASFSFHDCIFRENSTEWAGGALGFLRSTVALSDCSITENHSACYGAAIMSYDFSLTTLTGCTLTDNGGGHELVYNAVGSRLTLEQCTITRNEGDEAVLRSWSGQLTLDHTIIAYNFAPAFGGDGPVTAEWSNVYGNRGGDWVMPAEDEAGVSGNVSEDPEFCDPSDEELVLAAGSPCAEGNNDSRETIGAWRTGCSSAPELTTWTAVKDEYRLR